MEKKGIIFAQHERKHKTEKWKKQQKSLQI